jgi:multiple sugar transport system permease protein
MSQRSTAITRLLEDERRLAFCLMLPTMVLLALFIAYPFVNGILLAVTDTRVVSAISSAWTLTKIWSDDIFHVAV